VITCPSPIRRVTRDKRRGRGGRTAEIWQCAGGVLVEEVTPGIGQAVFLRVQEEPSSTALECPIAKDRGEAFEPSGGVNGILLGISLRTGRRDRRCCYRC